MRPVQRRKPSRVINGLVALNSGTAFRSTSVPPYVGGQENIINIRIYSAETGKFVDFKSVSGGVPSYYNVFESKNEDCPSSVSDSAISRGFIKGKSVELVSFEKFFKNLVYLQTSNM